MKKGDWVNTPRFCMVQLEEVFQSKEDAIKAGYTEPTYAEYDGFGILGKSIDLYHMRFAAYREREDRL